MIANAADCLYAHVTQRRDFSLSLALETFCTRRRKDHRAIHISDNTYVHCFLHLRNNRLIAWINNVRFEWKFMYVKNGIVLIERERETKTHT